MKLVDCLTYNKKKRFAFNESIGRSAREQVGYITNN